jgi:predicted acyl esterase
VTVVQLQPLLASLAAGQSLRLSLAGAAWPQIAVNPGNGSQPMGPSGASHRVISLRLDLAGSRLELMPLLEGNPTDRDLGAN